VLALSPGVSVAKPMHPILDGAQLKQPEPRARVLRTYTGAVMKEPERYVIETDIDLATARRQTRAHLRTPLASTAWSVGVRTGDMVVGFVVGSRVRARLIPQNTPTGRVRDCLLARNPTPPERGQISTTLRKMARRG
jgi:hypothetical protein